MTESAESQPLPPELCESLDFEQRFAKIVTIISLLVCAAVVLYVGGHFVAEWSAPPAPVTTIPNAPGPIGSGGIGPSRAVQLVNPGLRWLSFFLLTASIMQLFVGFHFRWHRQPAAWKLFGGAFMFALGNMFAMVVELSCGCSVDLF